MKTLISLLVSSFLVVGAFGCQEAPSSNNGGTQAPIKQTSETSKTREKTTPGITTDTKAKTETKKTLATPTEDNLKAAVTKKLQLGIPGNKLVVENKAGEITLKGTANSLAELEKAEKLAKEVTGVKEVEVEAKVLPVNKL